MRSQNYFSTKFYEIQARTRPHSVTLIIGLILQIFSLYTLLNLYTILERKSLTKFGKDQRKHKKNCTGNLVTLSPELSKYFNNRNQMTKAEACSLLWTKIKVGNLIVS